MPNLALPLLTLIIAIVSIQFGASVAKGLFPLVGAYGATALRLSIAAFILLIIWRPWRTRLSKKSYTSIAIYGVSLGLMNLLFYISLERIPLGIAVALEFTGPLAVSLIHSKKAVDFLWAILAAVGIFLILPLTQSAEALDVVGILFALGAGLCWALYILFGQKAGGEEHAGMVTSLGMMVAALVVLPFNFIFGAKTIFNPEALPLALGVAILSSALPYSLEMISLKRIPAKTFGILMSLEPAIAALMGFLYLSETLTAKQLVAIGCIICASLGGTMGVKTKPQHEG
jgi:inner membrane transporter RhtA